jgi:hypothetical protein
LTDSFHKENKGNWVKCEPEQALQSRTNCLEPNSEPEINEITNQSKELSNQIEGEL